jgi:ATP-dependent RNA helicase DeaD
MTDPLSATTETPNFSELGLPPNLCQTLSDLGYEQPSQIQAQAIAPLLQGRDVLGLAQTGTGKTAAFALPIISKINLSNKQPQALVLTPTRELAIQVSEAFQSYAKGLKGFHVLPIYGGQDMGTQLRQLKRGVQVVVGTPGRVMDHMRRRSLDVSGIQTLVLDEADEMLRMGFIDDVEWVLQQIPGDHQLALFSATMPQAIARITGDYLKDPVEIRVESKTRTVERIDQTYTVVQNNRKLDALTRILEADGLEAAIVFVRTKNATMELAQKLEARGFASAAINGDLNQKQRETTIENLRKGRIDILVATDVAARGIDVSRVSLVVNYDIPYDVEAYVHRIGRTGRAGRDGKALLLITPREKRLLKTIERSTRQEITHRPVPTNEEIGQQRAQQFRQRLMEIIENEPMQEIRQYLGELRAETDIDTDDLMAALAFLAQENKPILMDEPEIARSPEKTDRPDRPERKSRKERQASRENIEMEIYRLDAGFGHGANVKDIVGAIANELEIDSEYIGEIRLDEECSYVELPAGMPKELLQVFRNVRIRGQKANAKLFKEQVDMSMRSGDGRKGARPDARNERKARKRKAGPPGQNTSRLEGTKPSKRKHRKGPPKQ